MKAVLFDLDGVLIDSYNVWHAVINAFARDYGYPAVSEQQMDRGWGQGVDADAQMFFPGSEVEALEAYYDRHFLDYLDELQVTRDAPSVLEELRTAGCRTAIVTNTPTALTRKLLERASLTPDEAVGSSDVVRSKPAPDMVFRACDLLGVTTGEAMMVGDSPFDRDAAAEAGVAFLSYRWDGGHRIDDLKEIVGLVQSQAEGSRKMGL